MELFGLFTLLALALALSREYSKFVTKTQISFQSKQQQDCTP